MLASLSMPEEKKAMSCEGNLACGDSVTWEGGEHIDGHNP